MLPLVTESLTAWLVSSGRPATSLKTDYRPFVGRFCSEFTFLAKIDCAAVYKWPALYFSKCPPPQTGTEDSARRQAV